MHSCFEMFKLDKTLCAKIQILFQTWHRNQYSQVNSHDVTPVIKNKKSICADGKVLC